MTGVLRKQIIANPSVYEQIKVSHPLSLLSLQFNMQTNQLSGSLTPKGLCSRVCLHYNQTLFSSLTHRYILYIYFAFYILCVQVLYIDLQLILSDLLADYGGPFATTCVSIMIADIQPIKYQTFRMVCDGYWLYRVAQNEVVYDFKFTLQIRIGEIWLQFAILKFYVEDSDRTTPDFSAKPYHTGDTR